MKPRLLIPLILAATVLRIFWVFSHGVMPSEAYYWMCSHRLAAGFFDGPAGTALLVRAFGEPFEMARMFWPMIALFCSGIAWIFVRRIYDATVAGWSVVILNVLPAFNLAAVTVGPLMPALVSVLAGLVFARVAWDGRRWAWLGAALFFAVGLVFRYEAALVPAGLIIGAVVEIRRRTLFDFFGYAAIVLFALLALWPALRWNASWEWIPIAGGTWKTVLLFRWAPFVQSCGAFLMAFSVPLALAIIPGAGALLKAARLHGRAFFVCAAIAAPWGWVIYMLLRGGDAVTAGMFGILPLVAFVISSMRKHRLAVQSGIFIGSVALLTTCYSIWSAGRVSWKSVADEVRASAMDLPASEGGSFLIAESADEAAVLGYYLPGDAKYPSVFVPESPDISNQFGIWPSYADFIESDQPVEEIPERDQKGVEREKTGVNPFVGRNAIYVGRDLPQAIKGAFDEVQTFRKIISPDGKDLTVYFCLGYQTLPL